MSTAVSQSETKPHPAGYWAESADIVANRVMDTVMPPALCVSTFDCSSDCLMVGTLFHEFLDALTTGSPTFCRAYELCMETAISCYSEALVRNGSVCPEENPEDEVVVLASRFADLVDKGFLFSEMSETELDKTIRLELFLRRLATLDKEAWFGSFSLKERAKRIKLN